MSATFDVWKFPLEPTFVRDEFGNMIVDVEMPGDIHGELDSRPRVLTAANQDDTICVWAAVASGADRTVQRFIIVPTGNQFDGSSSAYVGTAFRRSLVFHVFHCF